MRIKVKRFFISTTLGNVDEGKVMDVNDGYARHLIANGLAEEQAANALATKKAEGKATVFRTPVVNQKERGSSSPADRVLPPKTAKRFESGAKKKAKGTSR